MMKDAVRNEIVTLGRKTHELTESAYRQHPATRGDVAWPEKQRILLADMALHLLQTSLRDGALPPEDLKRNLYAILTIADQFLPAAELKAVADRLLAPNTV
jgi:hypothetical protein